LSERSRIFDLEERVPRKDPFESVEEARIYDLDIRTSMIIPTQHMMKILAPHCRPGARLLEVGAGSGLVSLRLAALFPECEFFAVEHNDAFLSVLRENLIFANLLNFGGKLGYEWARYSRLPIEDHSLDVVFAFCSLNRWDRPAESIRECSRVCKPGGVVILYDLARDADEGMISFVLQYTGANHEKFMGALRSSFTVGEMRELLDDSGLAGWSVVREGINLVISSRPVDASFTVGEPGIYENIFSPAWSEAAAGLA
jgi:ubiquinone/menaquinone biosynthesis C-methylase UbiE